MPRFFGLITKFKVILPQNAVEVNTAICGILTYCVLRFCIIETRKGFFVSIGGRHGVSAHPRSAGRPRSHAKTACRDLELLSTGLQQLRTRPARYSHRHPDQTRKILQHFYRLYFRCFRQLNDRLNVHFLSRAFGRGFFHAFYFQAYPC